MIRMLAPNFRANSSPSIAAFCALVEASMGIKMDLNMLVSADGLGTPMPSNVSG
jgi:hypothetical protein